jgi:HrpA-like RNA helicase
MRRVPLEELCLQIKAMGYLDAQAFLSKAMDPPTDRAVSAALQTLTEVLGQDGNNHP